MSGGSGIDNNNKDKKEKEEGGGVENNPAGIIGRVYAVSTLLAVIIAVPAVVVVLITHFVLHTDIIVTLASSLIALFISMGFGIKISKRFVKT